MQGSGDVEHIIMDGMSADDTVAQAKEFAVRHWGVRIWSEEDHGQSAAMNRGIRLARGEIIGFLNVDDSYEVGVLSRVRDAFTMLPSPSLVVGACKISDKCGRITGLNRPTRIQFEDLVKGREFPWNPSSYFYHKALHEYIGGYDEQEHHVMDLDFLLRAVRRAQVFYFEEVWGNFRWAEGTKSYESAMLGQMQARCDRLRMQYSKLLTPFARLSMRLLQVLEYAGQRYYR